MEERSEPGQRELEPPFIAEPNTFNLAGGVFCSSLTGTYRGKEGCDLLDGSRSSPLPSASSRLFFLISLFLLLFQTLWYLGTGMLSVGF